MVRANPGLRPWAKVSRPYGNPLQAVYSMAEKQETFFKISRNASAIASKPQM
jgi:hypothetical protein